MYCTSCGIELPDSHRYCYQCGTATATTGVASPTGKPGLRLTRPMAEKKIAGVCAGIARYFGIDVTLVRIIMVCLAFWPPSVGLILYIVCWIVMPRDPLLLPPPEIGRDIAPVAN